LADRKYHLLCNAHLDPMWLWEWEEGAAAAVSTFRTAADLCEEFDGFIFNHNEALLYQWVDEYEPELLRRIQRLVKAGKWHIMGGWHVQPDCNMPSGESFVRQMLVGKRYFKEKFGVEPTTAINFDPFGHTRGLVQIIAKGGYDSYLFCRPSKNFLTLPGNKFVWVGYDGSEVMATRMREYNSPLGKARERVEERIEAFADDTLSVIPWGVGDHGGGPSRKDVQDLQDLISQTSGFEVKHSTPEMFFADLSKEKDGLPRVERDLNPWAVGCYTSQIRIKQKHRLLENELYATEKMAAAASFQGVMDYPAQDFAAAQYDLLTSQFHDILPGSSIQPVEEASVRLLDHGLETVARVKARAFFALASGQPVAQNDEIPVLVYNPHPYKVRAQVECEFMLADQNWNDSFTLTPVFKNGVRLPSQNIKEDSNINLDWRKRVVFLADLEPSCMNRFDCRMEVVPEKPEPAHFVSGDSIVLKTEKLKVVVNTQTGFVDKYAVNGVDQTGANAFEPIVIADDEDPWGMNVRSFRNVVGKFVLMSPETGTKFSGVKAGPIPSVRVIEDGPVRTVVEAVFEYGNSAVCQRYLVPKAGNELEIRTRVHWNEKDSMLKLSVPMPETDCKYLGQVAYGVAGLPDNGDESVAQKWVAVVSPDGSRALTCINDGIYGSDYSQDGLRITLVRSPAYSAHPVYERPVTPQNQYLERIDQGERFYRFWLTGGPAKDRLERVDREAAARNEKPYAVSFFPHGGGERPDSLVVLSDDSVVVSAVKRTEDGHGLVVRLFEPTGEPRETVVSFPFAQCERKVSLSAFEIKTLRFDPASKTIVETDLLEREYLKH